MAIELNLDYKPRPWQVICHKDPSRFKVIALHRRGGKTVYATMELIDKALKFKQDMGLFVFVAPFLSQAKAIAWGMIKFRLREMLLKGAIHVNEAELTITFLHNDAKIKLYGSDNPDALRGVRLDGAVLDEVSQMKPEVLDDIVQPALSDRKGWLILIGTPSGVNMFSEKFYKAKDLPNWSSKLFTVYDTDAIEAEEVERLRRDMSEASFKREYLCDFAAAGEDQLISLGDIEDSSKRVYKYGEFSYAPKIIGVDPARFGDDASVIIKRQGFTMFDPISFNGIDNMSLADQVAHHISTWKPDAVFIDAGNGSGIIDRLRQLGHSVIEVPFGGKSSNPTKYANKRAEIWDACKQWINEGGAIPNHMRLKQDLATPCYWFDNAGRMILEKKEDIKSRGLPSTDYGDAACLTFAAPVVKQKDIGGQDRDAGYKSGYDPFDRKHMMADIGKRENKYK